MTAMRELRALIADRLIWWAWRLDRDRFMAVDEKGRPVVETYLRGAAHLGNRVSPARTVIDVEDYVKAASDPKVHKQWADADALAELLIARGHCRCHLVVNCPDRKDQT